MRLSSRPGPLIVVTGFAALFAIAFAAGAMYMQGTQEHFSFGTQKIAVYVDGHLVGQKTDAINGLAYDFLMCKAFNDSTGCSQAGAGSGVGWGGSNALSGGSAQVCKGENTAGSASQTAAWTSKAFCSALGVVLSTTTGSPGAGGPGSALYCSNTLNANGITPVKATTSHSPLTNTVVLTASWTDSGSATSNVNMVCLFPWNDQTGNTGAVGGAGLVIGFPPILMDVLPGAPITVAVGQSVSVQWTISF